MESPLRTPVEPDFRLIETFAFRPGRGVVRQDRHLNRMARTAKFLGLPFDRSAAQAILPEVASGVTSRCRLTMDAAGRFELTSAPLADNPTIWRLGISETRLASDDVWLRHKTTRRAIYNTARAGMPNTVDELLFLNEQDELCEGSITNLFIETRDGKWLTPALSCGLLPGILREELLEAETCDEAVLSEEELREAKSVFVGNSLRGLIPVELVDL